MRATCLAVPLCSLLALACDDTAAVSRNGDSGSAATGAAPGSARDGGATSSGGRGGSGGGSSAGGPTGSRAGAAGEGVSNGTGGALLDGGASRDGSADAGGANGSGGAANAGSTDGSGGSMDAGGAGLDGAVNAGGAANAGGTSGAGGATAGAGGGFVCAPTHITFSPPPSPPCPPAGCAPPQGPTYPFEANVFTLAIPTGIVTADYNLDKHPDLVVTGSSAYVGVGLGLFVNHGDGTFDDVRFVDTPYTFNPFAIATGDMDHDGYPDIVVSDGGGLRVFFNNHDLTFPVHPLSATTTTVSSIAIGHLNGDVYPDIVVSEANLVAVMLNDGTGSFPTEVKYSVGSSATAAASIALGDVDHDGDEDVVYAEQYQVGVLLNDGKGTLKAQAASPYTAGHVGVDSPHSVALAKVDTDEYLDIVAANYGSQKGSVGVFINKGDGSFAPQVSYPTTANNDASAGFHGDYRPATADLDGDGDADLCVANWGDGTLGVFLNAGDGTFGAQQSYPAGSFPNSCLAADLNGDGHLDLAASSNESNGKGVAAVFFARCQ